MSTLVGMLLSGRYRLDAQIGAGGMSTVYRAFDVNLERRVAIKLLHREMSADSDQLERFRREARAVAQLSHPHIVGVIDAGEDENRPVHRLRVRRGRDAQGPDPAARAAAGRRVAGLRDRDRARARVRARARDRAPRRQAAERAARPRGLGEGDRLRDRPLAARRRADRRRPRAGHDRLRVARAGARPRRRRPVGHLLARRRALRDADRRRPVPRREPDQRGHEARPRGPAGHPADAPGGVGHDRRGARPDDREGPRAPLRRHPVAGRRPRGRAGDRGRPLRAPRPARRPRSSARCPPARGGGCRSGCATRSRCSR